MRFFVGVTDYDWFRFLASRPGIDEVNFWQPSGGVEFKAPLATGFQYGDERGYAA